MPKTKIRISPLQESKVQMALEIDGITKEDLTEIANSYLFDLKKESKSGNELLFSIHFDKKFFSKKVVKEGNPRLQMSSSKKLLSIQVMATLNESEIRQNEGRYFLETEAAAATPFSVKFHVTERYFHDKITNKRLQVDDTNEQ